MTGLAPIPFAVSPAQRRLAILAAFSVFVLFALVAQREGVRLSFDSYYYVEYAKEFRLHLPRSFGSAWPFGWPLLGSAAGLLGLSAYHGLLAASALSTLGLVALSARILPWEKLGLPGGLLVLSAGAGTFILTALVAGVLSEVPFAFALLAFALALAGWPGRRAILGSALLALGLFSLRYAGVVALVALNGWLVLNFRTLRSAKRTGFALTAVAVADLAGAALLAWNQSVTGAVSGLERGLSVPLAAWPGVASDFGWSLPAAWGGLGLRNGLGFESSLRLPVGWALLAGILALGWVGWRRGPTAESRALGAVVLGYALGLVALRCSREFDALHNARSFVPLLFPLLVLAAQLSATRRPVLAVCGVLLGLNAGLCLRGGSLQIGGDIRAALPALAGAGTRDVIAVNDAALTLSALTDAQVLRPDDRGWPQPVDRPDPSRFIVLTATPLDRAGRSGSLAPEWEAQVAALTRHGYTTRLRTPALVVLEHTGGKP